MSHDIIYYLVYRCHTFKNSQNAFKYFILNMYKLYNNLHYYKKTLNIMNFETKYLLFSLHEKDNIPFNV